MQMTTHTVGTREEWLDARRELLEREKQLTRLSDDLLGAYRLLDRAPRGRDEDHLPVPMAWWRRHDEYAEPAPA